MPAKPPLNTPLSAERLRALGELVRHKRKSLKISATVAAEAAGMSRVTWHRIEKGEPAVTIGAWMGALGVLGLEFDIDALHEEIAGDGDQVPARIRVADYPQLQQLAWHVREGAELTPREVLDIYERNLRHLNLNAMSPKELRLLAALRESFGVDLGV